MEKTQKRYGLCYQFGEFYFDLKNAEVMRFGHTLALPCLSARMLGVLVRNAPDAVSMETLHQQVWRGQVVSEKTLTQRIKLLRRSLGDCARQPRYIGSVRGLGYRFLPSVRVTPQNIVRREARVSAKARLWRVPKFTVHEVRLSIAALLLGLMLRADSSLPTTPFPVAAPVTAKELYGRAMVYYHRRADGDVLRAEAALRAALDIAPNYADAWVLLAGVFGLQPDLSLSQVNTRKKYALRQALSYNPEQAEAHIRLACVLASEQQTVRAQKHFSLAYKLGKNDPMVLAMYSTHKVTVGEYDAAVTALERAVTLHPTSSLHRNNLVSLYLLAGRLQAAEEQLAVFATMHPGKRQHSALLKARLRLLQGQPTQAIDLIKHITSKTDRLAIRTMALVTSGNTPHFQQSLAQLLAISSPQALVRQIEVLAYLNEESQLPSLLSRVEALQALSTSDPRAHRWTVLMLQYSPFVTASPLQPLLANIGSSPNRF